MHVQLQALTPVGATAAANTQVVLTITGVAGFHIMLAGLRLGYSGTPPSASPTRATISDGTTTMGFPVGGNSDGGFGGPVRFAVGATVTVTLPAGGAAAVGDIAAGYYLAKDEEV